MRQKRSIIVVGVVSFFVVLALWFYFTEIYYNPGSYRLGIRNDISNMELRDVVLRLEPHGQFPFGKLDSGRDHESWFMDPHWPVPTKVFVSFLDPAAITHSLSTTGAPPNFRGSICVVITKSSDYAIHLELQTQK